MDIDSMLRMNECINEDWGMGERERAGERGRYYVEVRTLFGKNKF